MTAYIGLTDQPWFEYLARRAAERAGVGLDADGLPRDVVRLDEVNFWRPSSQDVFRVLSPGEPFFLRLKTPHYAVAGFGTFAVWQLLSLPLAWEVFGEKNGAPSYPEFLDRIRGFRGQLLGGTDQWGADAPSLGCIILRDVHFLPRSLWLSWGLQQRFKPNTQVGKSYELQSSEGRLLESLLRLEASDARAATEAEFASDFQLLDVDERRRRLAQSVVREGQGSFRLRLMEAYEGRCAITGERTEPVLEAAHIQDYLGPASNHVQNGLVLRADWHSLYDEGLVTIVPRERLGSAAFRVDEGGRAARPEDLVVEVSPRIHEEWRNGRIYYERHGQSPKALPKRTDRRPSAAALLWHADQKFQRRH